MQTTIHQSKKANIKVVKKFEKTGDFEYIVQDYKGNFIERIGNRSIQEVNKYLKK